MADAQFKLECSRSFYGTLAAKSNRSVDHKIEKAIDYITQFNSAVVALSAGVDSSLVAQLARKSLGERTIAATALSESLPPGELGIAKRTADQIGIKHVIVETDELSNPDYVRNGADRCYLCKETMYRELRFIAEKEGFETILDGTHVDDLGDDRPGLRAAQEAGVKSPLLFAGFSKEDVREAAKMFGLGVWDKPAMPCLSSRITHGQEVTIDKLHAVGQAEAFIKGLVNVRNLRVRSDRGEARIEVSPEDRQLFFDEDLLDRIDEALRKLGFSRVVLDLRGYATKQQKTNIPEIALPMA
jgi:uncharacterized protein